MEGNLRFKMNWASLIVGRKLPFLLWFTLYLRAISKYKSLRGLYLEARFKRWVFCGKSLGSLSAVWRGLYMEGLIFGILRYVSSPILHSCGMSHGLHIGSHQLLANG